MNDYPKASTLMIFGHGRSGTSLITYIIARLGYVLMNEAHSLKHESSPIVMNDDGSFSSRETTKSIDLLNKQFSRWAWKSPRDFFLLGKFIHMVRNPSIIMVHRNPADMIYSASVKEHIPPEAYFRDYSNFYSEVADVVEAAPCHIYHLSFEKLKRDPCPIICQLADQLGLLVDEELAKDISKSVMAAGYKPLQDSGNTIISDIDLQRDALQSFHGVLMPWLARKISSIQEILIDILNAFLCLERLSSSVDASKSLGAEVDIAMRDFCIFFLKDNIPLFASDLINRLGLYNMADSVLKDTFPRFAETIYSRGATGHATNKYDWSRESSAEELVASVSHIWMCLISLRMELQRSLEYD